jgi:CheY-like chemotaxis protein
MIDGPEHHLLVVDDEAAVRMMVVAIFEPEGGR